MDGPALTPGPTTTAAAATPLAAGIHTQPSWDPLEYLPVAAAERLRLLRQRSNDLHALTVPFEVVHEASMAKIAAAAALKRLTDHPGEGGFGLTAENRSVTEAERLVVKLTEELQRINDRSEARAQAWREAGYALRAAETWLRDARPAGTALEDVEVEVPRPVKGETGLLDQIETRRRRVREMRADLHRIKSAPFPSAWAKQQMRAQIEALARAPSVSRLVELDGPVEWPSQRVSSEVHGTERTLAFHRAVDAAALTCWLHKAAMIAALEAEIDAESDDAEALTHEARQERTAVVLSDLLDQERFEAALVWAAQAQGLPCEHRQDCDPRAVLGVVVVTTPRADAAPMSSWMHAFDIVGPGRR